MPGSAIGVSRVTVIVSDMLPTSSVTLIKAVCPADSVEPLLLELLEPLELGGDSVAPERQQRGAVDAALVGDDDAGVAGVEVGHGDADARKRRTRLIADAALDGPVDRLRLRKRRRHPDQQQEHDEQSS